MAITIDWGNKIINIPRNDLQVVQTTPTEIRQLDLNQFRLIMTELYSEAEGIVYLVTHNHVPPIAVGGVNLARIIEIINEYTVTFEDGQYAVNLVGANSNVGDRVNVNQVSVRSANSAGLTYSKETEDQSFLDARIYINTDDGKPGTNFPRGTPGDPVDNLADAQGIITSRDLGKRLYFLGEVDVGAGVSLDGYNISGDFYANSVINLQAGSSSAKAIFANSLIADGFHSPLCQYNECLVRDATNLQGALEACKLSGTLVVTADTDMLGCYGSATIAILGSEVDLNIVNFSGKLVLAAMTDPTTEVSIGVISGVVIIDASCTAGSITVVDADTLIDMSGANCEVTVINQHLITQAGVAQVGALTDDVHKIHGLDPTNPLTVTTNSRNVGTISQDITGDGTTTSVVTRV